MRQTAAIVTLLILAGCGGGLHWHKPETSSQEMTADISACEREADRRAEAEAFSGRGGPTTAVIEVDRRSNKTRDVQGSARRTANLTEKARRAELFRDCMFAKGYRPARKS